MTIPAEPPSDGEDGARGAQPATSPPAVAGARPRPPPEPPALPTVSVVEVLALCGEASFQRARALLAAGGLQQVQQRGAELSAVFPPERSASSGRSVPPERGISPLTSVAFREDGLSPACRCPSRERYCAHVAALLLLWSHRPEAFARASELPPVVATLPRLAPIARARERPAPVDELAELLGQRTAVELRRLAQRWGLRLRSGTKEGLVLQLAAALGDPANVRRVAGELSPDERLALSAVYVVGGESPALGKTLAATLGGLVPDGGPPEPLLDSLTARGLLVAGTATSVFGGTVLGLGSQVPRALWPGLPELALVASAPPPAAASVQPAGALPESLLAVWSWLHEGGAGPPLLALRPAQPLGLLEVVEAGQRELGFVPAEVEALVASGRWQSGWRDLTARPREPALTDASLAAIAAAGGLPAPAASFAWELLRALGLVAAEPAGLRTTTEPALTLLRLGPARRLERVLAAWERLPGWAELELARAAGLQLRRRLGPFPVDTWVRDELKGPDVQRELVEVRRLVLRLLSLLPTDVWLAVESLQEAVRRLAGDALGGKQARWWLSPDGEPPASGADWRRGPGALVAALLAGPVHWLGLADLVGPAGQPTAFRLRPAARLLREPAAPAAGDLARVSLGPGLAVEVEPGHDDAAIHDLLAAAGRIEGLSARACRYRLTVAGLRSAFAAGQSAASLLAALAARTERVPDDFRAEVERLWQAYGRLCLYEGLTLVELADDALLPELLAATPLRRHLVYEFTPRLVAVDPASLDELLDWLRRRGYTPLLEARPG